MIYDDGNGHLGISIKESNEIHKSSELPESQRILIESQDDVM